jgi:cation:H+ antiporter
MYAAALILGLLVCFGILGKAADILVLHIRRIGERLGIGVFFLGLLLGLFTSFPELALGISAYASNAEALSMGNLLGGIPVLIGLVLGVSAIANREIKTQGTQGGLPLMLAYLALPVVLGMDGKLGMIDGAVLVGGYLLLVYALYAWHRTDHGTSVRFIPRQVVLMDLFLTVVSILAVLLISNLIVRLTLQLLALFHTPEFLVGLLVFAVGTNLPEIIVAIRAWKHGAADLSLNHLLGSAIVNGLLIGIFAFIRATDMYIGLEYAALAVAFGGLLGSAFLFIRSGNVLTRREGYGLLAIYAAFVCSQIVTVACDPTFRCIV